jgi:anti-sigma B factor antagonist
MATPRYSIARKPVPDGETRLVLVGEIDLAAHDALLAEILQVVNGSAIELVVDLDAVTFVDSGGVGVLVKGFHSASEAGCGYKVVNPQGIVRQVLEITGVLPALTDGAPSHRKLSAAS